MLVVAIFVLVWLGWLAIWIVAAKRLAISIEHASFSLRRPFRLLQIAGGLLIIGSFLTLLPDLQLWLSEPLAWMLLVVALAGIVFSAWGRLYLGELWSSDNTVKQGRRIVRTGPCAIVRHPIYFGLGVALWATVLAAGRFDAMIGAALLSRGIVLTARQEEEILAAKFAPGDYAAYQRDVPMFLPSWLEPPAWLVDALQKRMAALIERVVGFIGVKRLDRLRNLQSLSVLKQVRHFFYRAFGVKPPDDAV